MPVKSLLSRKFFGFELYVLSFFLLIFSIPWSNNFNSQAIILFCVITAITPSFQQKKQRLKSNLLWVYFTAFFILTAGSLIWDDQPFSSLKPLEKYVGFLFLPLFITAMPKLSEQAMKRSLIIFVCSTLIVLLICFVKSAKEYTESGDYRVFHYHYLSQQMELNAIYLALYCCFSIVILLYYFFIVPESKTGRYKAIALLLCLGLAGSIILLSAKMVIAILALVIISILLYIGFLKKRFLKSAILIFVICATGVVMINQIHYIKWRIGVTELKKYKGPDDNQNGLAVRQMIWESTVELIREKPLVGFGIQSASKELVEKYHEKNFELGIAQEYNAHNTYLQTGLHCGIMGIAVLLLLLGALVREALLQRNFFLFFFLLVVVPQSITESMFEVQKGIIFFVVFSSLFVNHVQNKNIKSPPADINL
jgi:O-antigen ligase